MTFWGPQRNYSLNLIVSLEIEEFEYVPGAHVNEF